MKRLWNRIKAFFEPQFMEISESDLQWLLANPERVGDYIRARIILG